MRRGIIKRHPSHMVKRLDLFRSGARTLVGRVRQHNIGARIRREFVLHNCQSAARIGIGREERGYVVIHLHAADGKSAVNARGQKRGHDDHALIHDLLRYFF